MVNKGLGRGLGSLIPKKINIQKYSDFDLNKDDSLSLNDEDQIKKINPQKIEANPYQPRKNFDPVALNDLISSIKEHGIIQPLIVSRQGDSYELISGERRLRSALELGLKEVPVIIRQADKQKKLELALIENLQREDLNPIESAIAYSQLLNEFNLTQEELSKKIGQPRSSITNVLRFLTLPEEIQTALIKKQITEAHAKYILGLENEVKQLSVFRKIIFNNLSVRETDRLIKKSGGTRKAKIIINENDSKQLGRLEKYLNTRVYVRRGVKGGKVEILFYDDEDLENLVRKITA